MRARLGCITLIVGLGGVAAVAVAAKQWAIHDKNRPQPPIVTPGQAGSPPSDAIVLFDGSSLDAWQSAGTGKQPGWRIVDGILEVVPKAGDIKTKRQFGDLQLHLEFATPVGEEGSGQDLGNSGVFLAGRYEVQVLNSYQNPTYPDGQCASAYGQQPPLVNASKAPGKWQTLDIIFHRPRFENGTCVQPATVTVLHNGVLVQDHFAYHGPTKHKTKAPYQEHGPDVIRLQEHKNPVRYRNIWVRDLE